MAVQSDLCRACDQALGGTLQELPDCMCKSCLQCSTRACCSYCYKDYFVIDNKIGINPKLCRKCNEASDVFDPKMCQICFLMCAFGDEELCRHCSKNKKTFGDPVQCNQCRVTRAFHKTRHAQSKDICYPCKQKAMKLPFWESGKMSKCSRCDELEKQVIQQKQQLNEKDDIINALKTQLEKIQRKAHANSDSKDMAVADMENAADAAAKHFVENNPEIKSVLMQLKGSERSQAYEAHIKHYKTIILKSWQDQQRN